MAPEHESTGAAVVDGIVAELTGKVLSADDADVIGRAVLAASGSASVYYVRLDTLIDSGTVTQRLSRLCEREAIASFVIAVHPDGIAMLECAEGPEGAQARLLKETPEGLQRVLSW